MEGGGRRTKRSEEIGSGTASDDSLGVGELAEAFEAVVTTHSRVARSTKAERGKRRLDRTGIHRRSSRLGVLEDIINILLVLPKDIEAERSLVRVHLCDGLLERVVRDDGEDWTEDLLTGDGEVLRGVHDEHERHSTRLGVNRSVGFEVDNLGTRRLGLVEQTHETLEMTVRDDAAAILSGRVGTSELLAHVRLGELDKRVQLLALNADVVDRDAHLP